jgi:hypothetical protein
VVKRIVRFDGEDGPALFEVAHQALANFQPGPREAIASAAFEKLCAIGVPKSEQSNNPDLVLLTLDEAREVELLESERDVIVEALGKIPWPVFAIAKKNRVLALLENAEKVSA